MNTLAFILGLLVLAALVTVLAVSRAPRGYQDEQGFHFLRQKK